MKTFITRKLFIQRPSAHLRIGLWATTKQIGTGLGVGLGCVFPCGRRRVGARVGAGESLNMPIPFEQTNRMTDTTENITSQTACVDSNDTFPLQYFIETYS